MAVTYNPVVEFPSKSNPSKNYTVSMRMDGEVTCNCPAWTFKKGDERTCKHVREVKRQGYGTIDGKFLISVDRWDRKEPIFCKVYPSCDDCTIRYNCWSCSMPEFSVDKLRELKIII